MIITHPEQRELLLYAFRYTLGRMSYAPHTVIEILKREWGEISVQDRQLIKREILEASHRNALGDTFDATAWLSILELV